MTGVLYGGVGGFWGGKHIFTTTNVKPLALSVRANYPNLSTKPIKLRNISNYNCIGTKKIVAPAEQKSQQFHDIKQALASKTVSGIFDVSFQNEWKMTCSCLIDFSAIRFIFKAIISKLNRNSKMPHMVLENTHRRRVPNLMFIQ